MLVIWAITGDRCAIQLGQCFCKRLFWIILGIWTIINFGFRGYITLTFLFLFLSILSESGANSYETGIMVSKAVEITINGKLLKPAGKIQTTLKTLVICLLLNSELEIKLRFQRHFTSYNILFSETVLILLE